MKITDPFTSRNFIVLKILSAGYVFALIISHLTLAEIHVWTIAAVLSVAMNFTYPWAAWAAQRFLTLEVAISATLIAMAILGVVVHPLFVIASIFGHGLWDVFKHNGQGVPFLKWYTMGCVVADWIYAAALLLYLMTRI